MVVAVVFAATQTSTDGPASFTGVARDPHDALLVGARVTVTGARLVIKERTDATGRFRINRLPPGVYSIRVETDGAIPFTRNGIHLSDGVVQNFEITLLAGKDPICVLTVVDERPKRKK